MNMNEFQRVVERVRGIWPQWKGDTETIKVWFEELHDFKAADVWDAVAALGRKEKFPPTLADIFNSLTALNRLNRQDIIKISPERNAADFSYNRTQGRQRVVLDDGTTVWEEERRAVFDVSKQTWRRKIDFVCSHLGCETVNRELKEITGVTGNGAWAALISRSNWISDYESKLNAMCAQVVGVLG